LTVMPNPFIGATTIQYQLAQSEKIMIKVMDINGRTVQVVENQTTKPAGYNEVTLSGNGLDAGMYYVFLVTAKQVISKKVILMR